MCLNWGFNDYCPLSNSSSVVKDYYVPNNSQIIRTKSNKNFYNNDYVYLFVSIEMMHTVNVSI